MNIGVYASLVRWAKQIRSSEDRRTADGTPDFSGLWQGPGPLIASFELDAADVLPWAKEVARQRRDEFFRTRPDYQCVPPDRRRSVE